MPRYIGYRPQFNPISLQEYLAVPTMLQQEYDTYEDKYNENLDKLAVLEGMLDDSTKNYLDAYKNNLNNAADIISGKSGNLSDLRQQVSSARQFYREYAPRLTNAYNKRQAALKTQQELLLKDPSAITTQVGNMQSFLDNPDQTFHTLSGDKIYADMINAGKMSAADITNSSIGKAKDVTGYLLQQTRTGYTIAEQQQYAALVQQALTGNQQADAALRSNPIYAQPYQVLSKYIEDNKFNLFDGSQQAYALNRALSGQLMGMTGTVDNKYLADKVWEENRADARAARVAAAKGGKDTKTDNPVRRLPAKNNPLESGNKKVKDYAEFRKLFEEIKQHPSILTAEMPAKTVAQMIQYANSDSRYTNQDIASAKRKEEQYKKRKRFEELQKQLQQDYPDVNFNISIGGMTNNQFGTTTPILNYDRRMDDVTADLGERTAGYIFNATDAAYGQIVTDIPKFAQIQKDGENDYIKDEKGKPVKNNKLRDIDFTKADVVFEDNVLQLQYQGDTYILEPGIFGYGDKEQRDQLTRLWESGQFDLYNEYMYAYLEGIADDARSKAKGQSNTDSNLKIE